MRWSPRQYLIAFNMVPGIGGRRLLALEGHFGSLAAAWQAPLEALAAVPGLGPKTADQLYAARRGTCPRREEEWAAALGARIITLYDEEYPGYLRRLAVPPPVLYVWGILPREPGLAVVGTRRPSASGIAQAKSFTAELVRRGETVISGLARGIDRFAHQTALDLGGRTVAVLGSNLKNIYPGEHRALARRIAEQGAVVSEFSSRHPTVPGNFPRRNRIIAGSSRGVLVVQAGARSGALRTADWALDLGLDIWSIPGEISDPLRAGNHLLIKQGAHLVTDPSELFGDKPAGKGPGKSLEELHAAGRNASEIAALLKRPVQEVLIELSRLQVKQGPLA
ncbi:MAG: DNA-processing protein DprA [Limnochordia bacterium]|jgi:DNA processing protein|nr:DNA-processing protein DprA [Limnochordia bacterium]MDI9464869.1 DNA-processing protein DprA [Bacillota bacterium]NLO96118.1 DNA-protecting protein DprA [Bacillota bacterium]HOB39775.1 DNA-processing protein DprA [Limnochordia bacterium]HOK31989.1 DNA-processing protein DprA [Limnochordia bacterium]